RGEFSEAATHLERAIVLSPTDALLLNDLAYARLQAGQLEAARIPIGKAAELAPNNQKILGNLALYLLATGDATQASQVMTRADLSTDARRQIYTLANDMLRSIPAPASYTSPQVLSQGHASPVMVRPMQDYFGNPPLVR